jgi:hypothetical protein
MPPSNYFKVKPVENVPFQYPKLKIRIERDKKALYQKFKRPTPIRIGIPVKTGRQIVLEKAAYEPSIRETGKKREPRKTKRMEPIVFDTDDELVKKYKHYLDVPHLEIKPHYFNNRYGFFKDIQEEIGGIHLSEEAASCASKNKNKPFEKMLHQEIVNHYLNTYTPYRGLLIYHGLGSGKTCTSISLLEGMVQNKKIFIMTPASLQANYRTQMKYCGNQLFRLKHAWKFEPVEATKRSSIYTLFQIDPEDVVGHPFTTYLNKVKGVWMVEEKGASNYEALSLTEKDQISQQIDLMIDLKYHFINYNGLTQEKWKRVYKPSDKHNPFDNSTIVIDEAHNFVSRIKNKLSNKKASLSKELYHYIMDAENVRVVTLTGTPFINYPSELGVLFNLIGGYTKAVDFTLDPKVPHLNKAYFENLLKKENGIDLLEYKDSTKQLRLLKNPYGFIKDDQGKLVYEEPGQAYFQDFKDRIETLLKKQTDFKVKKTTLVKFKRFPDVEEEFNSYFVSATNEMKSKQFFQSRIVGMVSYLGDKRELMPDMVETTDGEPIHIQECKMSMHQLKYYASVRREEREQDLKAKKKGNVDADELDLGTSSSYRFFSRSACNFVFPEGLPRPLPGVKTVPRDAEHPLEGVVLKEVTEEFGDAASDVDMLDNVDGLYDETDVLERKQNGKMKILDDYKERMDKTLAYLKDHASECFESNLPKYVSTPTDLPDVLSVYSSKFKRILANLMDKTNHGCHLLYSTFRTLEGIGLFRLAMLYHGFKELRIKRDKGNYSLDIISMYSPSEYVENHYFSLYTGTETAEQKEIIRNIYNNEFKKIPHHLQTQLSELFPQKTNLHGEIIKVLMITSSGAEGIDLKNTRFVHIMEPYWHHVRINQVIGRARRICSHSDLPKQLQTVQVFLYLTVIGGEVDLDQFYDIKTADNSLTTDESLYEIMERKARLSTKFLDALKEVSIDCALNHTNKDKCYRYPMPTSKNIKSRDVHLVNDPDYKDTAVRETNAAVETKVKIKLYAKKYGNKMYALDQSKTPVVVYDYNVYKTSKALVRLGTVQEDKVVLD